MVRSSDVGFDSQSVTHSNSEFLLASEVALCRLGGDVAERELDLIQLAAGEVAETGARASQVVRGQLVNPGPSRRGADHIPEHLRRHAVSPNTPSLVDGAEHGTVGDGCRRRPRV